MQSMELDQLKSVLTQNDIRQMDNIDRNLLTKGEDQVRAIFKYIIDKNNHPKSMTVADFWTQKNYIALKKCHRYNGWRRDVWKVRAVNNANLGIKS